MIADTLIGPHGHVVPRPDGFKARCGGPTVCRECAAELGDNVQLMERLAALYDFSVATMIERAPGSIENGMAHRSGLLAVYLHGLKQKERNVKSG